MATAKSRYEKLNADKTQFLQRGLMPLEGRTNNSHLIEPYQGMGSAGVTHLSSRLTNAFLPAGRPYMRLDLPAEIKLQLAGEVDNKTTKGLALAEQLIQAEVEAKDWRDATRQTTQQLLVVGNAMEEVLPSNKVRVYRLDQYAVRRDFDGSLLEFIIEECVDPDALSPDLLALLKQSGGSLKKDEKVRIYTWGEKAEDGVWEVHQELNEDVIPETLKEYEQDNLPYQALRWSTTPGEDYGRSMVEEHIADLRSLDALEKANLEMAGMASRNFIMVTPGATAAGIKNRLVDAINGDVVVGDPDSVQLKGFENSIGYQITSEQVKVLREMLARSFLLLSGAQRNAERVTAAEIERDISEIESALGGNFSTLSKDMMEWRTKIMMKQMKTQQKLPDFPDGMVVPVILTGLEALSRERDVTRAMQVAQLVQAFGEEAVANVKLDKVIGRALVGLGFTDAVRNEDEAAAWKQQQAQQQQALATEAAVVDNVTKG
jgi:hypothetical protein